MLVQGQEAPDSIQVRPRSDAAPPGSLRHRPDSIGLRPRQGGARQGDPRVRQEANPDDPEVDTIRLRSESSQSNVDVRPRQQPARDAEPRADQQPPSDQRDRRPIPDENETVQEDPPHTTAFDGRRRGDLGNAVLGGGYGTRGAPNPPTTESISHGGSRHDLHAQCE